MDTDQVKIARIDQKVISIEQWQSHHDKIDEEREKKFNDRFEKLFTYIKDRHDKTDEKLEKLWDDKNTRDGAIGIGKLIAGAIGGLIVGTMDIIITKIH